MLWFQPATGLNVRWDGDLTRSLQRTAPRVVMFGITNHCNLACHFCSRDLHATSAWTLDSAYSMLAGLARAGVLEVAFGGGEPLAFKGIETLIARLGRDTSLALHVTTNGSLLTPARLDQLAPWLGEIRLSIYDDNHWPASCELLAQKAVRFAANVLVSPARMAALPALLQRLAALGCSDVALLSYVGPERHLHLSAEDERQLSAVVQASPLRVRLSVCLGDRLDPLPRLFAGTDGDCGAGHDFVVLNSERKLKACSFHQQEFPVQTPDDVLRVWRAQRASLHTAASRKGCARPGQQAAAVSDGVRIWRGFSGNNSGDCVLVGRFARVEDARRYIADLLAGFEPGERFSAAWKDLLHSEGIALDGDECSPDVVAAAGTAVMLHTYSAVEDDFPALRALLWKRGGRAIYTGIHEHDPIALVAGMRCEDQAALESVDGELEVAELPSFHRRGLDLFAVLPVRGLDAEAADVRIAQLERIAKPYGASVAAELIAGDQTQDVPAALAARVRTGVERLWVQFRTRELAASFARMLGGKITQVGRFVLVEGERIGARLGQLASRHGGVATLIEGALVRIVATYWRNAERRGRASREPLDPTEVTRALLPRLRPFLDHDLTPSFGAQWMSVVGSVETGRPREALGILNDFADSAQLERWFAVEPRDRVATAISRVERDLHTLRRKPR